MALPHDSIFDKSELRAAPNWRQQRLWTSMKRASKAVPTRPKKLKMKAAANGGHRKGEDTRERILNVALKAFGEAPFVAVTTRQIAEAAGVRPPVLACF